MKQCVTQSNTVASFVSLKQFLCDESFIYTQVYQHSVGIVLWHYSCIVAVAVYILQFDVVFSKWVWLFVYLSGALTASRRKSGELQYVWMIVKQEYCSFMTFMIQIYLVSFCVAPNSPSLSSVYERGATAIHTHTHASPSHTHTHTNRSHL